MIKALVLALLLLLPGKFGYAQTMGMSPSGSQLDAAYTAVAVDSDGSNDWLLRAGLTGAADDAQGIFSAWVMEEGGSGNRLIYDDSNTANGIKLETGETIQASLHQAYDRQTTTSLTNNQWHHILLAWDLSGAGVCQVYFDGVEDDSGGGTCTGTSTIDWTTTTYAVGVHYLAIISWNGCLSEVYLNQREFLDMTSSTNRDLFRDGDGKPVDLGSDGSTPTGTAPIIYMKNAFGSWGTNSGTGGDFTLTGSFDECTSSPTD